MREKIFHVWPPYAFFALYVLCPQWYTLTNTQHTNTDLGISKTLQTRIRYVHCNVPYQSMTCISRLHRTAYFHIIPCTVWHTKLTYLLSYQVRGYWADDCNRINKQVLSEFVSLRVKSSIVAREVTLISVAGRANRCRSFLNNSHRTYLMNANIAASPLCFLLCFPRSIWLGFFFFFTHSF